MLACLWTLDEVITALITSRILIQFVGQIFALQHLRKHRSDIHRPFQMWLYPVPSVIAFMGWAYVFVTSGWKYVSFGMLTLLAGVVTYWLWRRLRPVAIHW